MTKLLTNGLMIPCKGIVLETMDQDVFDELKAQQENREKCAPKQNLKMAK